MLLKISKFFLHLSVFCVLVVLAGTFFPFIGGKYYFFRVSVELALIAFLLWWGFEDAEGETFKRVKEVFSRPLVITVSIFVLTMILASLFAYDVHGAFWSNYERGEGAFQMIHYYLFFLLLSLVFRDSRDWMNIFKFSLVAAVGMIMYGVLAQLGIADKFISPYQNNPNLPTTMWGKLIGTRFQGSLGNPAYVAPYLLFSIFYALYLWIIDFKKSNWGYHVLYGALIIFFLGVFILNQTRGAFLGLAAAVFAYCLYLIIANPKIRKWGVAGILACVLLGGVLYMNRNRPIIKELPIDRFLTISFKADSAQTRFWTWNSAWQGFRERPLLGWGQENFSAVFDKYFDPRHFDPSRNTETWFDRAHSVVFDYLAETGIVGFLSYSAIFGIFYLYFFKKREGGKTS